MIYYLGDSFFYGWNFFYPTNTPNRKELLFSHKLSQKLGIDYKNFSLPGSSNYRLCRLVNFLDITKNDMVILGWTACERLEVGVPKDKLMPNDVIIDYRNIDNLDHLPWQKVMQIVEKTDNIYTRSVYPTMFNNLDDINSPSARKLTENFYHYASDFNYHQQMFKILFNSALHRLRTIGCKFMMFTTWDVELQDTSFLDIPEYILHKSNILDEVRYKNAKQKHRVLKDYNYWSVEEHDMVTELLYNNLRERYDIQ
jgi:hypothetical protein